MSSPSIKSRFLVSFASNILRGILSFATSLVFARGLGPDLYGNYIFILSSFMATVFLLDLGTSKAFFTFLSQKQRGFVYIIYYSIWQGIQFVSSVLMIWLIMPGEWISTIWVGQERELIVLGFVAVFLQHSAWKTMVSIGESLRMTHRLQFMNICLAGALLLLAGGVWLAGALTIKLIFLFIAGEYLVAILLAIKVFSLRTLDGEPFNFKDTLSQYRLYCTPLILISIFGFMDHFLDRWLLQYFGGSVEQGFFGIASQFSVVCLVGATSMVNIFWKEIAEAKENNNLEVIHSLFQKASRLLYMLAAVVSGFLIPWSTDIVRLFLGADYEGSVIVLAIMFLSPLHQSLSYFLETLFLATEKNRSLLNIKYIFWGINIPVSYFILAKSTSVLPGLDLGATGMALKVVVLQVIIVNLMIWWVSKEFNWGFDWAFQVVGLGATLSLGWLAYEIPMGLADYVSFSLFFKFGLSFLIYVLMIVVFLWRFPWVAGVSRGEIRTQIIQLKYLIGRN